MAVKSEMPGLIDLCLRSVCPLRSPDSLFLNLNLLRLSCGYISTSFCFTFWFSVASFVLVWLSTTLTLTNIYPSSIQLITLRVFALRWLYLSKRQICNTWRGYTGVTSEVSRFWINLLYFIIGQQWSSRFMIKKVCNQTTPSFVQTLCILYKTMLSNISYITEKIILKS